MYSETFIQRIAVAVFLFFFCFHAMYAQGSHGTIAGEIRSSSGNPLEAVSIVLEEKTELGTSSNAQGAFELTHIPEGKYSLRFSSVGYKTLKKEVIVQAGQTTRISVALTEQDEVLSEVEVRGLHDITEIQYLPQIQGTAVFAGKKNEVIVLSKTDANTALNNTRQIFAKVPGISIWENDGSGIQVGVATRGLSPNRSWEFNVRQNGYDVSSDIFGYPEAYYNPPMEAVEHIQVVRGAASLQYGPQFGGILNYNLKKGDATKPVTVETQQTVGSYGLYNTYNAVGGTVGKFNYYGAFNYRRAGGWRQNSDYDTYWGYANIRYSFTPKLTVGFEISRLYFENQQPGGLTDAQFEQDPRQSLRSRNWFSTPWTLPAFTVDYSFSNKTRLSVKSYGLFGQRNSVGFVQGATVADTINPALGAYNNRQVDRDIYRNIGAEVRFLTDYALGRQSHTLAAGVRVFNGHTSRKQLGKGTTGNDFDLTLEDPLYKRDLQFSTLNYAVFAENVFRLSSRLSVTPGIRYEWVKSEASGRLNLRADGTEQLINDQKQQRHIWLAGIGMEYKTSTTTNVYANFSQAYRPVLFSDLTPPATTDEIDPDLKDANGYNADFGFRGNFKNFITFDVGGFYLKYNNRIGTLTQLREDGTTRYQYRTNIGASVSQGIEAFVEIEPLRFFREKSKTGNLSLFASMAFIDAIYTGGSVITGTDNVLLDGKKVENAPAYIHRFGATYALSGFSTTFQLSSVAQVYTDATNTAASGNGVNGLIPAYQVIDWSFTYRLLRHYNVKGGINNLSDKKYFTRRAAGYPGPGLLPSDGRTFYLSLGARF